MHQYHGGRWGEYVDVKMNAPELLAQELARLKRGLAPVTRERNFLKEAGLEFN